MYQFKILRKWHFFLLDHDFSPSTPSWIGYACMQLPLYQVCQAAVLKLIYWTTLTVHYYWEHADVDPFEFLDRAHTLIWVHPNLTDI